MANLTELRIYKGEYWGAIGGNEMWMADSGLAFPVKSLSAEVMRGLSELFVYETSSQFNGDTSRHGFADKKSVETFKILVDSKAKAGVAAAITNTICVEHELETIVANGDVALFQSVPGVGKKTASEIITSLRGVFKIEITALDENDETYNTLLENGYTTKEAKELMVNNPQKKNETQSKYAARLIMI